MCIKTGVTMVPICSVYQGQRIRKIEPFHCMKSVRIQSFSGPYFPAFGLNKEKYSVSLRIQSECWKIRTRKTPNTSTFHAVFVAYTATKMVGVVQQDTVDENLQIFVALCFHTYLINYHCLLYH